MTASQSLRRLVLRDKVCFSPPCICKAKMPKTLSATVLFLDFSLHLWRNRLGCGPSLCHQHSFNNNCYLLRCKTLKEPSEGGLNAIYAVDSGSVRYSNEETAFLSLLHGPKPLFCLCSVVKRCVCCCRPMGSGRGARAFLLFSLPHTQQRIGGQTRDPSCQI